MNKHPIFKAFAFATLLATSFVAIAQETFPGRAVTLVVPGQPGSTSDLTARVIGKAMSSTLGQPVVVDNRPGAAGAIAMQYVAKAKPDGYTLVVVVGSTTTVPPAITKVMPYDMKDFAPVSMISTQPLVLVAATKSGINSVADLVARAKAAPGKTSYGNAATMYQLAMEMFNQQAGTDILGINYKGPVDASNDLIGGRLEVMPDSLGSATRSIQSGRVKVIALMGPRRHPLLPDVPTLNELGFKDFEFAGWGGIMAPAGTPVPILHRLSDAIAKALQSEEVKKQYATLQVDAISNTPEEFGALIARETAKFEKIARDAKIEKQ